MYKKSYGGYKSSRYKFSEGYNKSRFTLVNFILSLLQDFKYLVLVIVVLIVAVVVTIVFAVKNDNKNIEDTTATQITTIMNIDEEEMLMMVVNRNNPIDKDFVPELVDFNGYKVNTLAVDSLDEFIKSAERNNIYIKISKAYISYENQKEMYRKEYNRLLNSGDYTFVTAEAKAQTVVPKEGRSEFQTGLLFEFATSVGEKIKENSKEHQWLENNAVNYGFVLRYPKDKEDSTLMNFDCSVYRYVGKDKAEFMRTLGLCFDEYNEYISARE